MIRKMRISTYKQSKIPRFYIEHTLFDFSCYGVTLFCYGKDLKPMHARVKAELAGSYLLSTIWLVLYNTQEATFHFESVF